MGRDTSALAIALRRRGAWIRCRCIAAAPLLAVRDRHTDATRTRIAAVVRAWAAVAANERDSGLAASTRTGFGTVAEIAIAAARGVGEVCTRAVAGVVGTR